MATIFQQKLDRFALLFDVEEAEHTRHFYAASKIRMEANSLFPPLAARIVSWRENNTFSFGIIEERNPNYSKRQFKQRLVREECLCQTIRV